MNWEDLRLFDAAASSGSLSAGARALGLSQPQMSRRLRDLEAEVGARLFDRTPQGLRPTGAGAKLIPLAEEMRKAAEVIARAKPDLATRNQSVVRISIDEIRESFLTQHLDELLSPLEDIEVEIFSGHEHLDHESRKTDIQIRSCLPDSETLIAKRLGQTGYALYASKTFADRHNCLSPQTKLEHLPWIGISPDHLWYPLQRKWLLDFFQTPSALRCNNMTAIMNAVRSGAGMALLPCFMAESDSNLVRLSGSEPLMQTVEYLVVHRDLLREKAVRRTVDALTQIYKVHRGRLEGTRVAPGAN